MSSNEKKTVRPGGYDSLSMTKSNFGRYGWLMIVISGLLFLFCSGNTTDSLNVIVGAFAEKFGFDSNLILGYNSLCGYISIIGITVINRFMTKTGVRNMTTVLLLLNGILYFVFASISSVAGYIVVQTINLILGNGFAYVCGTTLMANWFPRKKGLALGWSTIGVQCATFLYLPVMNFLLAKFALSSTLVVFGVAMVALAVVCWIVVRDYPEEKGLTPDNADLSREEIERSLEEQKNYKHRISVMDCVKNRDVWLIGITFGCLSMCVSAVLSQFIPRCASYGIDINLALVLMSVSAAIGVPGSYIWGWVDQKVSTKKSIVAICVWFAVSLILFGFVLPVTPVTSALFMVSMGAAGGGIPNLSASMLTTIFGRQEYAQAYTVFNPIMTIIRTSSFAILAVVLSLTSNSYSHAYLIFGLLAGVAAVLAALIRDKSIVEAS